MPSLPLNITECLLLLIKFCKGIGYLSDHISHTDSACPIQVSREHLLKNMAGVGLEMVCGSSYPENQHEALPHFYGLTKAFDLSRRPWVDEISGPDGPEFV